jgi:hypothetical protein
MRQSTPTGWQEPVHHGPWRSRVSGGISLGFAGSRRREGPWLRW